MQTQYNCLDQELMRILKELRLKDQGLQWEAARKLRQYLQKHSEDADIIFKELTSQLTNSDLQGKLGTFIAINQILPQGKETIMIQYVNKLIPKIRELLEQNTPELVEKAAECLSNLARAGGSISDETSETTIDQAIEWLRADYKNNNSKDIKRYSGVLVLKEFCKKLPNNTFNKIFDQQSYIYIIHTFRDHRQQVRDTAAEVICICLKLISDRQNDDNNKKFKDIYAQIRPAFTENDVNFQQSALTVLYELISTTGSLKQIKLEDQNQNSNKHVNHQVMQLFKTSKNQQVKKKCIEIIPQLFKYMNQNFSSEDIETSMNLIFAFITQKDNKDKGQGFISLGRMSILLHESKFEKFKDQAFTLILSEIQVPAKNNNGIQKPLQNTDVLICVRDIMVNYGQDFDKKTDTFKFINNLFYYGLNKQLIDALKQLTKICNGRFQIGCELKLLNTISIILKQQINYFPLEFNPYEKQKTPTTQTQQQSQSKSGAHTDRSYVSSAQTSVAKQQKDMVNASILTTTTGQQTPLSKQQSFQSLSQQTSGGEGAKNYPDSKMSMDSQSMQNQSLMHEQTNQSLLSQQEETQSNQNQVMRQSNMIDQQNRLKKRANQSLKKLFDTDNQNFLLQLAQGSDNTSMSKDEQALYQSRKTQMLILALKALATFGFHEIQPQFNILQFIADSVLQYLDDENPQIRNEAVKTCCSLSFQQNANRLGVDQQNLVNKLLHKFFVTATTDNDYRIRCTMLRCLNDEFDPFISRYENLLMLFNCIKDSNNDIKDLTIRILGRLVPHNASQILPYLRNLIVSLISQLEHSQDLKEREEAAKLIKTFVKSNKDMSRSYANSILHSLIQRIETDQSSSAFKSAVLDVIREISYVDSDAIKPYLRQLFPLIIDSIKDLSSHQKREIALKTMISIIENTGFVVKPYFYYPNLMPIIRNLVNNEQNQSVRKLVFKLLGTLGAVDPYLMKQINLYHDPQDDSDKQEILGNLPRLLHIDQKAWDIAEGNGGEYYDDDVYGNINDNYLYNKKAIKNQHYDHLLNAKKDLMQLNENKQKKQQNLEEIKFSKENKYPAVAIKALMRILVDPTLREHHQIILQGLNYIFQSIHQDAVPFLPLIIPKFLMLMRQNDSMINKSVNQCMINIVDIMPKAVIQYSDIIFETIQKTILTQPEESLKLLNLLNKKCKYDLMSEMYQILPQILQLIEGLQSKNDVYIKSTDDEVNNKNMLNAIQSLNNFHQQILDDYLHLIVPLLLRIRMVQQIKEIQFRNKDQQEMKLNIQIIKTLMLLVECQSFKEHMAPVVHQLISKMEISSQNQPAYIENIVSLFIKMANVLTIDFAPYFSLIQRALKRNKKQFDNFDTCLEEVSKENPIILFETNLQKFQRKEQEELINRQNYEQNLNQQQQTKSLKTAQDFRLKYCAFDVLLKEFNTDKLSLKADWDDWLKKTSNQLLKQSPSPILFACSTVAEWYTPLYNELYNIAFVSCWKFMSDKEKQQIMQQYQKAIKHKSEPTSVLQTILNLAEFMELDESTDIKLFSYKVLAGIAENCNAHAKALYYWEMEFDNNPRGTIELLIQTNYGLQQPEAAYGILEYAKKHLYLQKDNKEDETFKIDYWYEKLHDWDKALDIYENSEQQDSLEIKMGKINCYKNLSDWQNLYYMVEQMWDEQVSSFRKEKVMQSKEIKNIAPFAVQASWNLGKWDHYTKYLKVLNSQDHAYEKNFYQAILDIKNKRYDDADKHIEKARDILDPKLTSLLGESYDRAYSCIQELQLLKELEEIIEVLKRSSNNESRRDHLYSLWSKRFNCVASEDMEMYQKSLNIRKLMVKQVNEVDHYINFAVLAQERGNNELGTRVLSQLRNELNLESQSNRSQRIIDDLVKVEFAIAENQFKSGFKEEAVHKLQKLLVQQNNIEHKLLSLCYVKLSQWQFEAYEDQSQDINEEQYKQIIDYTQKATQIDSQNHEAWHYYSQRNYDIQQYYSNEISNQVENESASSDIKRFTKNILVEENIPLIIQLYKQKKISASPEIIFLFNNYIQSIVCAIRGLVQQMSLSSQMHSADNTKTLQNTLRLLKLWFNHGSLPEIEQIIREGFDKIDLKVWIHVIPQLLARINIKENVIRNSLNDLLERISQKFPQALIYSLSVTEKSTSDVRKEAAQQLIEKLKLTQNELIEQATQISNELIRAAIVLGEIWSEAIEEASRIYFGKNDAKAMIEHLKPFHKIMEKQPETMNEIAFYQGYASDLEEAQQWAQRYMRTQVKSDLNQAWDLYFSVFKKISSKQKEVQYYELKNIAHKLLESENLLIAIPGTFKTNKRIIKIEKFKSVLNVLPSKQHPRKMQIKGNDAKEYIFLLKGHEDIRQDERVMQLFGLVNNLLLIDPKTQKKDITIRRYHIIPLSQNTGLIGWVPNTDTLNVLIKEHRQQNNIIPQIELKLMETMCEQYDTCPLPNKVEIFRYALDKTMGQDLQKVLWLKSLNSELWLERRTNYTRSLAVMSMVGYILGLGDRHPSNIMLERASGKIVHIDFGDCFEIASRREKFPEKFPFRLTRMLIKAMEVSGIEGNFRTTCQNTMRVMRANKDSLLAILEAFAYDPLISFRLLNPKILKQNQKKKDEEQAKANEEKLQQIKTGVQVSNQDKDQEIRASIVEQVITKYQYAGQSKVYAESKFSKRVEYLELQQLMKEDEEDEKKKELNQTANIVIKRIKDKLSGHEFHHGENTSVNHQVENLIKQATSHENLAQCYMGWCPYW